MYCRYSCSNSFTAAVLPHVLERPKIQLVNVIPLHFHRLHTLPPFFLSYRFIRVPPFFLRAWRKSLTFTAFPVYPIQKKTQKESSAFCVFLTYKISVPVFLKRPALKSYLPANVTGTKIKTSCFLSGTSKHLIHHKDSTRYSLCQLLLYYILYFHFILESKTTRY